eukprot:1156612-Pelagomonas_calceolata.AAC.7
MEQPYLQQVSVQAVHDFLLQHNNKLYLFTSDLISLCHKSSRHYVDWRGPATGRSAEHSG